MLNDGYQVSTTWSIIDHDGKLTKENRNKLKPGEARVEFIKNIDEIKEMLLAGHSIMGIHRMLTEKNKITMSYQALYRFIHPQPKDMK